MIFTCVGFDEEIGYTVKIESVTPGNSIYEKTLITDVKETDTIGWLLNRFFKNKSMAFSFNVTFHLRETSKIRVASAAAGATDGVVHAHITI